MTSHRESCFFLDGLAEVLALYRRFQGMQGTFNRNATPKGERGGERGISISYFVTERYGRGIGSVKVSKLNFYTQFQGEGGLKFCQNLY